MKEAGLELGTVKEETSETVAAGLIINQDIKLEDKVVSGTSVNVVISSGPASGTPTPTLDPTPTPEAPLSPTPEASLTPTAAPTPTAEPVVYYSVFLDADWSAYGIEEGTPVEYIIELEQGNSWYGIAESVISEEQYQANGFTFKLYQEDFANLEAGTVNFYLYLLNDTGELILRDFWEVELQELTE